jgi:NAD(P)-dependent dehydrogenase (short-subunit alcohol dehydrogenase family)
MKTIVIIGGSRGIGLSIAKQQSQNNNVICLSRTKPDFESENLQFLTYNSLTDELPNLDKVDSLIYCPGSIVLKPINRLSLDDFREDFEINVIGAVKAIQKYLPTLKKGEKPSILLFSSVAAKLGMPFHASIAASKSAIEGIVKSVGAELASKIRINAIAPSITQTDLSANILKNEDTIERMKERHPLKKILQPEEVADLADFLISEKANSISGQTFELDGGIVTFKI